MMPWWTWVIMAVFWAVLIWIHWPRRRREGPATWEYEAHDCPKPNSNGRGVGSAWRCSCGKLWRIVDKRWNGPYETTSWRPF